ncbi:MAG: cysteine methyltransferase, partial [Thermoleophilia bacterium]|nr:cysteine methyltransferase [Thermoleophilia bacterium]
MTVPTEVDVRFRAAASRPGLLDVAYDVADSPIGPLLLVASDAGLEKIWFCTEQKP